MSQRIETFEEFWPFYLREHSKPWTRRIHVLGTTVAVVALINIALTGAWLSVWIPFVIGYAFAWPAHFLIEKNKPATFKYPAWSFISDFKMCFHFWTMSLDPELEKAGVTAGGKRALAGPDKPNAQIGGKKQ